MKPPCGLASFLWVSMVVFGPLLNPTPSINQPQPRVLGANIGGQIQLPLQIQQPDLASVKAESFLAYDETNKVIIVQHNPDLIVPIASLTKLLTACLTEQYMSPEQTVTITSQDRVETNPVLDVKVGDQIKVNDLISAMLIGSANDAAQTLGDAVARQTGQSFVDLMNKETSRLGMTHSHFANPIGFDDAENFSTAKDLLVLVNQARQQVPLLNVSNPETSYAFKSQLGRSYYIKSTSDLAALDPEVKIIKTGHTTDAQDTMITEVNRNNHRVILIILGSPNREQATEALKNVVFTSFLW